MIDDIKKKLRKGILKTSFVALASAFGAVAGATPVTKNEEATYWKTQTFDAVIAMKPCTGTGVCGEIHWMNPSDHKLFDYFGDRTKKGAGPVTDEDVRALCGFSPKIDFKTVGDNRWQGTMELRGMNMTVNVDALRTSDTTMRVDTSKLIIRQSET